MELESVIVKLSLDGSVKQEFAFRNCVFTIEQIIAHWSILGIKFGIIAIEAIEELTDGQSFLLSDLDRNWWEIGCLSN